MTDLLLIFFNFLFQSRTQRFMGFGICLFFGVLCFILSFLYIPILLLQARKFALLFTLGSMFFITRYGTNKQIGRKKRKSSLDQLFILSLQEYPKKSFNLVIIQVSNKSFIANKMLSNL